MHVLYSENTRVCTRAQAIVPRSRREQKDCGTDGN